VAVPVGVPPAAEVTVTATGRGNPYIGGTLGDATAAATRTQTSLAAKYRHLCTRMPKKKAQGAIMRAQLCIAHAILSTWLDVTTLAAHGGLRDQV
jgi:hypothetical protein